MISFPNAKINLGLNIIEKRADGYHNIESVFYPVGWKDVLEILPSDNLNFKSSGIKIPGKEEENLCLKAYHLLKKDFDIPPVNIYLHKILPIGAGLGGGSSDAAFTLIRINELFELKITNSDLQKYAKKIGSDCAFFIENKPKFCYKKGDSFKNSNVDLSGKYILLIFPEIHVSTAEAYRGIVPTKPENMLKEIIKQPITDWKYLMKNDFEETIFQLYPELNEIKKLLYSVGAIYASMSGSGSTMYGIFEKKIILSESFKSKFLIWEGEL